jgi:transposase
LVRGVEGRNDDRAIELGPGPDHDRNIGKNVFQVHGIDAKERVVVRKQLRRGQVIAFFRALPPCVIGMEACATAH